MEVWHATVMETETNWTCTQKFYMKKKIIIKKIENENKKQRTLAYLSARLTKCAHMCWRQWCFFTIKVACFCCQANQLNFFATPSIILSIFQLKFKILFCPFLFFYRCISLFLFALYFYIFFSFLSYAFHALKFEQHYFCG